MDSEPRSDSLSKGLSQRHLTMIAMGGVIGAGLFVGSGVVIDDTGPAVFLTYALSGLLVVLVIRMLGEMAAAYPTTGSFSTYAGRALGPWAGFSVAWLYWYFWVIVIGFEAIAGGKILQYWIHLPVWVFALILMLTMTVANLFSIKSYGEFEFWFAGVKVAAVSAFLILGTLYVLGLWPGTHLDFSNLTALGGFFPKGIPAVFTNVVVVIVSMVGAEVVTIAAAESEDPRGAIARATRSIIIRILLFFVGSTFLLCVMMPWNSHQAGYSPFTQAMKLMKVPHIDTVMNLVVLTAVLSCLNVSIYTASRMLYVLAERREAPQILGRTSRRGVPAIAIFVSTLIGFACVAASAIFSDGILLFLLNSTGAIALFIYIFIAISQLRQRRKTPEELLTVKMWGFPWLSYATLIAMCAVVCAMFIDHDTRTELLLSLGSFAVVLIGYLVMTRLRPPVPESDLVSYGEFPSGPDPDVPASP